MEELFIPDLDEVKHQVEDEDQQERVHLTFFSLGEQWERYTQNAQRLHRRQALIQLPERERVRLVRTPTVPERALSDADLEELQATLARQSGRVRAEAQREIARREQERLVVESPVRYYEEVEP